jgi:hypothetical protein
MELIKVTAECQQVMLDLMLLLLQVCLAQGSSVNSVLDVRVEVNTGKSLAAASAAVAAVPAAAAWDDPK